MWVSKTIEFFQVCFSPSFAPLVLVANREMRVPPVSREMHCRRRVECTSGAKLHCTMQWEDAQWGVALLKGWGVSVVLVHLGGRCITQWEDALREDMQWWDALHVTVRDTFEGREKIPIACDENHFEVGSILYLNLREWVELTMVWLADSGKLILSKTTKNTPTCQVICCTRSYAALRAADLDWIVGPGYSLGRKNVTDAGSQLPWEGGGAGISKNVTDAGSQLTF